MFEEYMYAFNPYNKVLIIVAPLVAPLVTPLLSLLKRTKLRIGLGHRLCAHAPP
jgi:hypothetical protein